MAAKLFYLPFPVAFTSRGVGAPGAKAYFYETGTTTPLATYTTDALSIEHPHPIVANASGRFPEIYLDNAVTARCIINDSSGAELCDIDPYVPGTAPDAGSLQPYADASEASAVASSASASAASTSASTASTHATNAASSASGASASATAAAASAVIADNAADAAALAVSLPSAAIPAANRTALKLLSTSAPGHLMEAGREGMFVFDSSNLSAEVAADTAEGVYVAPSSAPTGASGAWVRKVERHLNLMWFGAVGDNLTDDLPAFQAAIALIKATATNDDQNGVLWKGGYSLYVPPPPGGMYYLSGQLEIKGVTLTIEGDVTQWGMFSPTLRFANDSNGIVIQFYNTTGSTTEGVATGSSQQTVIRGLRIKGGGTSLTSRGVWRRAKAMLEDVFIEGFGYGDYIYATSGGGGEIEGNANGWGNIRVRSATNRRSGVYRRGADANAGVDMHGDYSYNGEWGIDDETFLGNHYDGWHLDRNGTADVRTIIGLTGSCSVAHGGNIYYCVSGQEVAASTTTPGTNENIWGLWATGTGGSIISPAWSSGITVVSGGPMRVSGLNNATDCGSGYSEGTHSPLQIDAGRALRPRGFIGASGVRGGAERCSNGVPLFETGISTEVRDTGQPVTSPTSYTTATLGGDIGDWRIMLMAHTTHLPSGYYMHFRSGHMNLAHANSGVATNIPWTVYLPGNAEGMEAHTFGVRDLALGNWQNGYQRRITYGPTSPASGAWNVGEFCFNTQASTTKQIGWICTAAGSPGTWQAVGALIEQSAIANIGAAPSQADFNGLLAKLRSAGVIAP